MNTLAPSAAPPEPGQRSIPRDLAWLALFAALFLLLRIPAMFCQPGGMDEDWFAIPGWTVAHEGIPRVPFAPERNPESYFWEVDTMLFALPPAFHYWQAPFFWIFPAGNGTARLASAIAGVLALGVLFLIALRLLQDRIAALLAVGLFSLARTFYFPATFARPDMLCGLFGLTAILSMTYWESARQSRWLIATGISLGLAGLTHPFALVFALQAWFWLLLERRNWLQFVKESSLLIGVSLVTFSLWLPLIAAHPEIFRAQFFSNVLNRSLTTEGDAPRAGLLQVLRYQAQLLNEHAGPIQLGMMGAGIFTVAQSAWRRRRPGECTLLALTLSSILLLVALQGRHPTKGYWVYPAALAFIGVGQLAAIAFRWTGERLGRWGQGILVLGLGALLIPGSGLRASLVYAQNYNSSDYHASRFIRRILDQYPAAATYLVDPAYVFDSQLAGRKTILGVVHPSYFHAQEHPFDYYLVSRYGIENGIPQQLNTDRIAQYGKRDDPFACYLEVHRPRQRPNHAN
ncbi:glycosyltransferase family 39 protein [Planctomicrobium sp. SH664]|uniref:glycosyltransferase family 39 protein n=1 Tax=Planctomicrobium sp. SH664 TaxID=3448125 RepID=UPI003F5BE249